TCGREIVAGNRNPSPRRDSALGFEELDSREQFGKVSTPLRLAQHPHTLGRRIGLPRSLIVYKEEQLIFENWTAKSSAKLVVAKAGPRLDLVAGGILAQQIVAPVVGIEHVVAQKFKQTPVIGVGSGLDRRIHNSAQKITELGGRILRDEVEFLDGIHVGRI